MTFHMGFFLWFFCGLQSTNGHAGKPPSAWRPQLLQPWHPCFPNVPHRMRAFWAPWRHHRIKRVGEAQWFVGWGSLGVFGRGRWPYETSGLFVNSRGEILSLYVFVWASLQLTASRLVEKYCDFLMQMPETELLLKEVCSSNQLILDEIPVMPSKTSKFDTYLNSWTKSIARWWFQIL